MYYLLRLLFQSIFMQLRLISERYDLLKGSMTLSAKSIYILSSDHLLRKNLILIFRSQRTFLCLLNPFRCVFYTFVFNCIMLLYFHIQNRQVYNVLMGFAYTLCNMHLMLSIYPIFSSGCLLSCQFDETILFDIQSWYSFQILCNMHIRTTCESKRIPYVLYKHFVYCHQFVILHCVTASP